MTELLMLIWAGFNILSHLGPILLRFPWSPRDQRKWKIFTSLSIILYPLGVQIFTPYFHGTPLVIAIAIPLALWGWYSLKKGYEKEQQKKEAS